MTSLESSIRGVLRHRSPSIAAAYLFGSHARGDARADSDLDIAILYAGDPPRGLEGLGLDLAAALERSLERAVDVVILNTAPVDLVHRVLRDGCLLLDQHPSTRIRFEVRARNEYFDLQPVLARYRGRGAHA